MLSEILHELINAVTHRVGLDRAGELHELVDKFAGPAEVEPEPTEPAASVAPGA